MNSPDCGNQRTGHPRCAQLMAKTWNCSPWMRRTQQGMWSVSPSETPEMGFLKLRQPSLAFGKLVQLAQRDPALVLAALAAQESARADSRSPAWPEPTAARPFNSKPILANRSRRETSALSSAAVPVVAVHSMDTSRATMDSRHGRLRPTAGTLRRQARRQRR